MRTSGLGKIVQCLGISRLGPTRGKFSAAEMAAAYRNWHDTAGLFRAVQGVVDGASGYTLPEGIATGVIGSIPRNTLSAELGDVARPLPGWHTKYIVTDSQDLIASEVAEGLPVPVAGTTATSITITPSKCSIIIGYSQEMIRDSDSFPTIESDFTLALQRGLDAVILSRLAPDSSGSFSATANPMLDLRELITPLDVTGVVAPILCGHPDVLLRMSTLRDSGGQVFAETGIGGGHAIGMPIYPCDQLPANGLRAINGEAIGFKVSGIQIDTSEGSVQMNTAPTQDATAGTGSTMVSGFQNFVLFAKFEVDFALHVLRDGLASTELVGINW